MSTFNDLLGQHYQTTQPQGAVDMEELSKLAAEAAAEAIEEGGGDIENLSEEELEAVASELSGEPGEITGEEEQIAAAVMEDPELLGEILEADPELAAEVEQALVAEEGAPAATEEAVMNEEVKEAARQIAVADFTGRHMAHSMTDELNKIAVAQAQGQQVQFPMNTQPTAREKLAYALQSGQVSKTDILREKIAQKLAGNPPMTKQASADPGTELLRNAVRRLIY